jgi:hypothetical protein
MSSFQGTVWIAEPRYERSMPLKEKVRLNFAAIRTPGNSECKFLTIGAHSKSFLYAVFIARA